MLRHPGHAKVTTSRPGEEVGGAYEIWISDGELVRTYVAPHKLGTQRPIRNRPRGLDDPDFPGMSRVYEPVTALPMETLPDTFVHPAGYCQNVLATGRCRSPGHRPVDGREAILPRMRPPADSRDRRATGPTTDRDRGRSRHRRHPAARGNDRRRGDPRRDGDRLDTGRAAPAVGVRIRLPDRDDDALLSRPVFRSVRGAYSPAILTGPIPARSDARPRRRASDRPSVDSGGHPGSRARRHVSRHPRSPCVQRGAPIDRAQPRTSGSRVGPGRPPASRRSAAPPHVREGHR